MKFSKFLTLTLVVFTLSACGNSTNDSNSNMNNPQPTEINSENNGETITIQMERLTESPTPDEITDLKIENIKLEGDCALPMGSNDGKACNLVYMRNGVKESFNINKDNIICCEYPSAKLGIYEANKQYILIDDGDGGWNQSDIYEFNFDENKLAKVISVSAVDVATLGYTVEILQTEECKYSSQTRVITTLACIKDFDKLDSTKQIELSDIIIQNNNYFWAVSRYGLKV